MGNKNSHGSQPKRCSFCGYTFERSKEKCIRCDGLSGSIVERVPLKSLHCGVIVDPGNEMKVEPALEEEQLLEILRKHFASHKEHVRRGIIFQTQDNSRFKILHCHPPAGRVLERTNLFVNGPSGAIIRLNTSRIIRKLDLKPLRASLPPSQMKSMKNSVSLLPEITKHFREASAMSQPIHLSTGELFTTSSGIEFRVMKVESDGQEPGDDGIVDLQQTIFYCSGSPIDDIENITILPIYETLPNREKNYTAQKILETYIKPHTCGLSVYVQRLWELRLNGVDFAITACNPESGVLTCNTTITNTRANIRAGDWKSKKMEEDAAFARRLQGGSGIMFFRAPQNSGRISISTRHQMGNIVPPQPGRLVTGQPGPAPALNPNNRLQVLQHMLAMINTQNLSAGRGTNPLFTQLLGNQLLGMSKPTAAHLSSRLPTRTYKKPQRTSPIISTDELKVANVEIDDEATSPKCRICLEHYEDGDEVKTLPCFHFFHTECIDKWFQFSDECCICKNSLTESIRQDIG